MGKPSLTPILVTFRRKWQALCVVLAFQKIVRFFDDFLPGEISFPVNDFSVHYFLNAAKTFRVGDGKSGEQIQKDVREARLDI